MKKKRGLRLFSFMLVICLLAQMNIVKTDAMGGTVITITGEGQIVDTFNGVSSLYRPGDGDGSDSTYGCHAYVIRYYQAIYGKTVYNLFRAQTPLTYGDYFVQVTTPQPGDICAQIKATSNHWSIVKSVSGTTVSVIDQNNKWVSGGVTYAYQNFYYDTSEVVFYRLASLAAPAATQPANNASVSSVTSMNVNKGKTKQITADYVPVLANAPSISWASSRADIAAVSPEGYVTGVKKGSAVITGTLNDGQTVNLNVKVKVPAKKMKLVSNDVTLPKSYKWKIGFKVTPSNSTDTVKFSSSNKSVATVSKKGLVRTKAVQGMTKITVKTSSGKKKKCIVRVY